MQELTIKLPDKLWRRLKIRARTEKMGVEEVILERLKNLPAREESDLQGKYNKFFKESGLFIQVSEQEKRRYEEINESEREALAQQFSIGKPLSEMIIDELCFR